MFIMYSQRRKTKIQEFDYTRKKIICVFKSRRDHTLIYYYSRYKNKVH